MASEPMAQKAHWTVEQDEKRGEFPWVMIRTHESQRVVQGYFRERRYAELAAKELESKEGHGIVR